MDNNFDKASKYWDSDPDKIKRAEILAGEIIALIKDKNLNNALEFGCGTSTLSILLKNEFKRISLIDNSEGMLNVLKEKILKNKLHHFIPVKLDLEKEDLSGKFDIIYSFMTMHHVINIDVILEKFNRMLVNNGILIIADLEKEDGTFHLNPENEKVHHGFERSQLTALLANYNFSVEYYNIFYKIEKNREDKIKEYPLFILMAKSY